MFNSYYRCNPVGGDAIPGSVSIDERSEHYDAADMDAVLAPWVAWQDAHCAKIQRWVRGRQAKKRVMARPTVVARAGQE